jgi:spermidine/putrescine transport system permease protein
MTAPSDIISVDEALAPPKRRRLRAPKFLLALPAWIWFVAFFLAPLGIIVYYSFGQKKPLSAGEVVMSHPSFTQYSDALSSTFIEVFKTTLKIASLGTFLCLLIGFPMAYFLGVRVKAKWKGVLLGLVIIPFWTNFLIRTLAWTIVLASRGYVSNQLQSWGVLNHPLNFLATKSAVQLGVVYNYLPLMIFPLFVAFDRLDPAMREASKDLGANRIRTFVQVTLPLAAPGIIAGILLVYIPLCGDYITAKILGKAKGNMVGAVIASQFIEAQNTARGSAMAVILIIMILGSIVSAAVVAWCFRTYFHSRRRVVVRGI